MIASLISVLGALFRRYWGGWFNPNHWVKLGLGFSLPAFAAFAGGAGLYASLIIGLWSGLAFLNPFHGEGVNMGRGYPANPSLAESFLIMGGSYSFYFLGMSLSLFLLTGILSVFFLLGVGSLIPLGYWLAYLIWEKAKLSPFGEYPAGNFFIDGATSIGELFLGSIIFLAAYVGGCCVQ